MEERDWTDRPLAWDAVIATPTCRVTRQQSGYQSLVSGDLAAGLTVLAPGAAMIGFAETPAGADYAIRIARDRALLVTQSPPAREAGWQAEGVALSPAGECYACLALSGTGAMALLAQGLTSAPPTGSPSAALRFAGLTVLVTGAPHGCLLWVDPASLSYVTGFLSRLTGGAPAPDAASS